MAAAIVSFGLIADMPWVLRNYVLFHRFIPLRSNLGLELWIGNHPSSDGTTYGKISDEGRGTFFWAHHPFSPLAERKGEMLRLRGKGDFMAGKMAEATEFIRSDPAALPPSDRPPGLALLVPAAPDVADRQSPGGRVEGLKDRQIPLL